MMRPTHHGSAGITSKRVDVWQLFNEVTREAGGEDCRRFGMLHANPFHAGDRFVDLRRLLQLTPFVFCDHQSRDELNGFEQNSINGDLLRLAAGGQVPVAQSMAHLLPRHQDLPSQRRGTG
jgi:hypothetical protein